MRNPSEVLSQFHMKWFLLGRGFSMVSDTVKAADKVCGVRNPANPNLISSSATHQLSKVKGAALVLGV